MNNQNGLAVAGATSLTEALSRIQKQLKAPKNQKNSFGNYNYRSCEDILEAVKPLLGDGIVLLSDEIVMVGDRFYVKATATFSILCESKSVSAYARESLDKKGMDSAQITGAASSYARKYALNGLFCIDDTKDADTNGHNVNDDVKHKPEVKTPQSKSAFQKIYDQFEEARKSLGDERFYVIVGNSGYEKYDQIKNIDEANKILKTMADAFNASKKDKK